MNRKGGRQYQSCLHLGFARPLRTLPKRQPINGQALLRFQSLFVKLDFGGSSFLNHDGVDRDHAAGVIAQRDQALVGVPVDTDEFNVELRVTVPAPIDFADRQGPADESIRGQHHQRMVNATVSSAKRDEKIHVCIGIRRSNDDSTSRCSQDALSAS